MPRRIRRKRSWRALRPSCRAAASRSCPWACKVSCSTRRSWASSQAPSAGAGGDTGADAGASSFRGRSDCNDYSIGIELEGLEGGAFEVAQYERLARLCRDLRQHYPINAMAGHEHIAPGRKQDPGSGFDWRALQRRLRWPRAFFADGIAL